HTLRPTSRTGRVAHRGRRVLVAQLDKRLRLAARDKGIEIERAVRNGAVVADDDDVLEWRSAREPLERQPEGLVDDDGAVSGVRRDVRQLVGVQPDVEGV